MSDSTPQQDKQYTFEELQKKLTEKERIFCHQYIIDWNGARAARSAGYSQKTAKETGYENLTKPHIKQYISIIKNNLEEESGISKLRNLQELAKIAYSNIAHLHDTWIELSDWEQIKRENPNALDGIDTKTETRVYKTERDDEQEVETKYVKIKLYPKLIAIKEINEMMGYKAPVKLEHDVKDLSHLQDILDSIK